MRGMLGTVELRGAELIAAAEAHDALFSFDYRARTAALEVGMPILPPGEILFVNLDPRAVLDVESSMRTTWPVVGRLGADPSRICLELIKPERCPDRELLHEMVAEHRKRGAQGRPRRPLRRPRVARLPRAPAPGHRQDRHRADRRHPALPGPPRARQGARRLRPRARRQGRRRGRRARGRVPRDGRAGRRPRPGLLLRSADREADGGRHPPRASVGLLELRGRIGMHVGCVRPAGGSLWPTSATRSARPRGCDRRRAVRARDSAKTPTSRSAPTGASGDPN